MKSKVGILLMFIGCISIIAAVLIVGTNINTDYHSGKKSREILICLENELDKISDNNENFVYTNNESEKILKQILIDDYSYIGIISIPDIGVELPVMSSWNYDNLKIAPCLFYDDKKSNKKIIAAHNYSSHFGNIKELNSGNYITFRDVENNLFLYEVIQTEVLDSTDIEKMINGDDWDLTLFTCTLSGLERVTVRCREVIDIQK